MSQGTLEGLAGQQRVQRGPSEDWLTPPYILDALGPFDLDPCAAAEMPWRTARVMLTEADNGLLLDWAEEAGEGALVWLNPPYGRDTARWLERLTMSGLEGLALIFARTETDMFQRLVFDRASGVLFVKGRVRFHLLDGRESPGDGGAPSAIVAYGDRALNRLEKAVAAGKLKGCLVTFSDHNVVHAPQPYEPSAWERFMWACADRMLSIGVKLSGSLNLDGGL